MINFLNIFKSGKAPSVAVKVKAVDPTLPKCLQAEYAPNHGTFLEWAKGHRDHQSGAIASLLTSDIGQVSLPTGTGKTRVQVHVHVEEMIRNTNESKFGVHVIGAHRLALCNQLLHELVTVVANAGLPFDILFLGSDHVNDDAIHAEFRDKGLNRHVNEATSTTRQEEVLLAYQKAQAKHRHLVVVSTYHSFHKLAVIPHIDICTYDEAHTLVGESFFDNILKVKPLIARNYFFTATRKVQGKEGGMNRLDVFGPVLYEKSPRSMIEAGEIVPPKLHIIDTVEEGDFDNHAMLVKTVIDGFSQHKTLVKQSSCNPDSIGAKLLITTTGNKEMMELHTDPLFQEFCRTNGVRVFAFSAEHGAFADFCKIDREAAMTAMRAMPDCADAIMVRYRHPRRGHRPALDHRRHALPRTQLHEAAPDHREGRPAAEGRPRRTLCRPAGPPQLGRPRQAVLLDRHPTLLPLAGRPRGDEGHHQGHHQRLRSAGGGVQLPRQVPLGG